MRRHGTGSIENRGEGSFRVKLRLPNGETATATVASRPEAEKLLRHMAREAHAKMMRGDFDAPVSPPVPTLTTWGAAWIERRDPKDRPRWRRYVIGAPLAAIPLATMRPADVAAWVDATCARTTDDGRRISVATASRALALVRKCLGDAVRVGLLDANPARGIAPQSRHVPTQREPLTVAELRTVALCDAIPARSRCCYVVAFTTGLRPGELWALRWGDITASGERAEVHVHRSHRAATTKTGRARRVPLLPEALFALGLLRALDDFTTEPDDLMFPTATGRQRLRDDDHGWSSRKVRGVPRVGQREVAGVRSCVAFYGMRHGCATALVQGDITAAAVPIAHVQRALGHTSITTTQRYAHLAPEYLHAAFRPREALATDPTMAPRGDIQGPKTHPTSPQHGAGHAEKQAPSKGLEPLTGGLEIRCSGQLSYEGGGVGRGDGIRTRDNELPKLVHYQAVRLPERCGKRCLPRSTVVVSEGVRFLTKGRDSATRVV